MTSAVLWAAGSGLTAQAQNVIKIGEVNSYKAQPAFLEPYRKGGDAFESAFAKVGKLRAIPDCYDSTDSRSSTFCSWCAIVEWCVRTRRANCEEGSNPMQEGTIIGSLIFYVTRRQ